MARVNLDGKVWKDPRVKRLAKRRTWSLRETIGTLAAVWDVSYDLKTPIMRRIDVDTAAETDGFADDMIVEDLATPVADDLVSVRLRGVSERIGYLLRQAELGRRGGLAKAKRTPDEGQAAAKPTSGLPLDLPPPPPPAPALSPEDPARELARVAVAEINRLASTRYQDTSEAVLKDCLALSKRKRTAAQVTRVIGAKWAEWSKSEHMREQFKPSVLLRRSNFERYLDDLEARAKPAQIALPRPAVIEILDDDGTVLRVPSGEAETEAAA